MTIRRGYLFSAVIFTALAMLAFLRLSETNAEVNSPSTETLQEGAVSRPKSIIGASGVMAFVIMEIRPGCAAEQSGLRPGDLVTGLDGQINSIQDFQGKIVNSEPGTTFNITYRRFNRTTGEMEERKATVQTRAFGASVSPQSAFLKVASARPDCPQRCCEFCTRTRYSECLETTFWTGKRNCFSADGICSTQTCT
jgi:membrane-associated protease RseP (regulator of RpoE activity)